MALGRKFIVGFLATIVQLDEKNYFTKFAPESCCDGWDFGSNPMKMKAVLASITGLENWPLDLKSEYPESTIVEYIEGLYQIVAKPTESWVHDYCGFTHPKEYDVTAGRYEFTIEMNRLFESFSPSHTLRFGKVVIATITFLDLRLIEDLNFGDDEHLKELVTMAILDYQSTKPHGKWKGLRSMADAFERVKSDSQEKNKKVSVESLIVLMGGEADLTEPLNQLLSAMTGFSNFATIRHHEKGKEEILADQELIVFLFHAYFNIIKFALQRMSA